MAPTLCPICESRAPEPRYKPFCSRRCADVDLQRWFSGRYAVPAVETPEPEMSSTRTKPTPPLLLRKRETPSPRWPAAKAEMCSPPLLITTKIQRPPKSYPRLYGKQVSESHR